MVANSLLAIKRQTYAQLILVIMIATLVITLPCVEAAKHTIEQNVASALTVTGIDTSKYNISTTPSLSDLYQGVLPSENVHSTLNSSGSSVDAYCTDG
jgi:hypothetical protein